MLKIRLQGKDERNYEKGILALDVAKDISEGLARSVVGAKIDGKVCDLMTPLTDDCDIEFLKFADKDGKMVFWHTSTHIMAQAVKRLYPNAKLGTGPALDNGFYYDIDLEEKLTVEDLEKIEKEIATIIKNTTAFACPTPSKPTLENIVLTMFIASISVLSSGAPAVRAKFWSYSLKLLVNDKKVHIVIDGITIGMVTFLSIVHLDAPSISAASIRLGGTF